MAIVWKRLKISFVMILTLALILTSSLFSVLLYGQITGKPWAYSPSGLEPHVVLADHRPLFLLHPLLMNEEVVALPTDVSTQGEAEIAERIKKTSAMIDAPGIRQYPELYNGCEVTSLTMLLQYYGYDKTKLELAKEMDRDETPIEFAKDGSIAYWGNPNIGFVGDVTGKQMGFGIFHGPLLKLMEKYIPSSLDMTNMAFSEIEQQVADGFPVIIWTTIDYQVPKQWLVWDTPLGPIQTTFKEHAVLLVGYDEENVYVNDPANGRTKIKINKQRFLETWEAMGKQAISYKDKTEKEGEDVADI